MQKRKVKQLKKKFNRIVNDLNKRLKAKDKMVCDMREGLASLKAERERLVSSYETKIKEHVHTMEKYHADIQLVRKQQEKEGENMKKCEKKILPIFNRVVIFSTTDFSYQRLSQKPFHLV